MRVRDLSIGRQLGFGLSAILLLVVILGITAYLQSSSLWQSTRDLYSHPLTVRRALGMLKVDVLSIHLGMKDLVLATEPAESQAARQRIAVAEASAHRQFDVLRDRYLGPQSDVADAVRAFAEWQSIREETQRLLAEGKVAEARRRTTPAGVGGAKAAQILEEIEHISEFSLRRGDAFFREAAAQRRTLEIHLEVLLAAILLLSAAISFALLRGIRTPLKELANAADALRQGDLNARSPYQAGNEFGTLSATFNRLAETIQAEIGRRESVNHIADRMLREDERSAFARSLLQALLEATGSQVGALYLLNPQKTAFEHFDSIGLDAAARTAFSATAGEGEFGLTLATRKVQHIREIPGDTRLSFPAVAGDLRPRAILTVPILSGPDVAAVISLASIRDYSPAALRLIDDLWSVLNARLNGVLAFHRVREFSARLEQQNQELEAQKRELTAQADELSEQNIELSLQKKQLDEANRLKNVFLSNMSHELRTPLNSVIALAGVLRRRLQTAIPEEEAGFLEIIERNGRNLLELINDILDLSRIEAGREELHLNRFSMRALAGEIAALIEPQAREKGIVLVNRVKDDLPALTSDADKCRHILQNLVGNAVKFTLEGSVEITAVQEGDDICVAVTDTGIGIAAEHLTHIFDEFRQADEGTARRFGGTGLGLAIAKRYARLLGGSITVASTPGQGSTFTLRLPLTMGSALPADPLLCPENSGATDAAPAEAARTGARILVVEDSEPAVIQIRDALIEQGYCVQVARNGREALAQVETQPPDAMILDLMMPEVDGFEVLRQIRAVPQTACLPVLILTAKHVTRQELSFLKNNHIKQLIQKGDINRTELLARVADMVTPRLAAPAAPLERPNRPPPAGKPVILVVEDNPDNRATVRALLQDGHTVIEATDGQAGLDQARTHTPDLVLLDISLPVMDGFTVLGEIRKHERLRHTPVVALTARAMKGDREEILAYGFDGYLAKPVEAELLVRTIKELLYGK